MYEDTYWNCEIRWEEADLLRWEKETLNVILTLHCHSFLMRIQVKEVRLKNMGVRIASRGEAVCVV